MHNFKPLANLYSWAGQFVSYLDANLEEVFLWRGWYKGFPSLELLNLDDDPVWSGASLAQLCGPNSGASFLWKLYLYNIIADYGTLVMQWWMHYFVVWLTCIRIRHSYLEFASL